ncbi:endonuclease/exonuclease/phosphatase family protein [Thiobacter aerophilum]|uniref:Endonuclease/exonuclease/phosphatase family protein n=1 Tax=Thiobacter aerophilum TaxID=3121275 RepID=A0ABV0EFV4_9BURK
MSDIIHITTYNIHKGFSQFNARMVLHELKEELRRVHTDIAFLQEVLGEHRAYAERHNWPTPSQYEYLADSVWPEYAYGKNAVYSEGHHGNAILSRFAILNWENIDISAHPLERRGLLHCEIAVPGWTEPLYCVNVHLGLGQRGRNKQLAVIRDRIQAVVPPHAPLIIAGDFNDWRGTAGEFLARTLHVQEVFEHLHGAPARSYPASLPLLRLDRIYFRGLKVKGAQVYHGRPWSRISDHAVLTAAMSRA